MGDRTVIQFRKGEEYSEQYYMHWGGIVCIRSAMVFARELKDAGRDISPQECLKEYIALDGSDYNTEKEKQNIYPEDSECLDYLDNGSWVIDMDSCLFDA